MNDDTSATPKSFVLITFSDVNSVDMQINLMNVSPAQVLAAASMLEVKGKNAFIYQENERMQREAEASIARPSGKIELPKGR